MMAVECCCLKLILPAKQSQWWNVAGKVFFYNLHLSKQFNAHVRAMSPAVSYYWPFKMNSLLKSSNLIPRPLLASFQPHIYLGKMGLKYQSYHKRSIVKDTTKSIKGQDVMRGVRRAILDKKIKLYQTEERWKRNSKQILADIKETKSKMKEKMEEIIEDTTISSTNITVGNTIGKATFTTPPIKSESGSIPTTTSRLLRNQSPDSDSTMVALPAAENTSFANKRENVWTVPNLLCVSRILMSPYLGYLILEQDFHWALCVLTFAGVTDLLDGWIARTFKSQSSKLGSFLDPMADKVLIATMFLTLTYDGIIPVPLTTLIIIRDVSLVTAGFIIRYKSLPPPRTLSRYFDVTHATAQLAPTSISKVNTMVQLITVACTLAAPVFGYLDHPLLYSLWYVTAGSTVASAGSYLLSKNTFKFLKKTS